MRFNLSYASCGTFLHLHGKCVIDYSKRRIFKKLLKVDTHILDIVIRKYPVPTFRVLPFRKVDRYLKNSVVCYQRYQFTHTDKASTVVVEL